MEYLWVGLGGFAGANARYVLATWVAQRYGTAFPAGTLLINVTGSLAIGIIVTLLSQRTVANPLWRLLLVVGFLGGYTTFSSFTSETIALIERGAWIRALLYVLGSNVIGLLACLLGVGLVRMAGR